MPIFVETCRATVAPSDCDHLGHMNVQHYFATVSDGMFAFDLGLGAQEILQRKISFAVVRAETDFHHELGTSWPWSPRSLHSARSLRPSPPTENVATGTIAMSTEFKCVLLDLEKRKAISIPDAAATQLMTDQVKS